jgi:hypothetical protein
LWSLSFLQHFRLNENTKRYLAIFYHASQTPKKCFSSHFLGLQTNSGKYTLFKGNIVVENKKQGLKQ